jgi:Flp pilus assembly pilin Flp
MRLRSLIGDTRGATAVEFALLSPLFFGLVLMLIQTATGLLTQQLLEGAADKAERLLQTAPAAQALYSDDFIREQACSDLLGLVDCNRLQITILPQIDPARSCRLPSCPRVIDPYGRGSIGDIIRVEMNYLRPDLFTLGDLSALFSVRRTQFFHVVRYVRKEKLPS